MNASSEPLRIHNRIVPDASPLPQPGESILDEHELLLDEIESLQRWWSEAAELGKPKFGEMGGRVAQLRNRLAEHFELEESGGYMAAVVRMVPRLAPQAEHLRREHSRFLHDLDELTARLMGRGSPLTYWSEAQAVLDEILSRVQQHEHAEKEMLQSAFADDVGAGD